ncbi:MAG TPA: hypothetical protein VFB03_03835 [Candidatus Saccharimonadales bacterium]|nr:hypothetical protein [Candidatus Saccharimonadales bacterium]
MTEIETGRKTESYKSQLAKAGLTAGSIVLGLTSSYLMMTKGIEGNRWAELGTEAGSISGPVGALAVHSRALFGSRVPLPERARKSLAELWQEKVTTAQVAGMMLTEKFRRPAFIRLGETAPVSMPAPAIRTRPAGLLG